MLKKISLFLLTTSPFFALISCSSIYKFYEHNPKSENKSLLKNQKFQEFVDSVFANNESQKQDYISNQINQNSSKITNELKYSLIFARPYFNFSNDQYYDTRLNSNYTIHSYLAKNWLFLLENIDKLSFIFNPYLTRFVKTPNEIEAEKLKNKTIKILNTNFDFIKIDREQDQFEKNTVYYLIFDKNKFLRFTVFGTKSELKTKLDYNLFYLNEEIPDKFLFVNSIENWIKNKEENYFKKKLEEARENLKDQFEEKKKQLENKISNSDSDDEDEDESNDCTIENLDKCSEAQRKFLEKTLRGRSAFVSETVKTTNFQDEEVENSDSNNSDNSNDSDSKNQENSTESSQDRSDSEQVNSEKSNTDQETEAKSDLANLEKKYQSDLANLEENVKKQISLEKNELTKSNFFTNITSDISDFQSPFKFYKYSLFSIDLQKSDKKDEKVVQESPVKSNFLNKYSSFIDKNLEIKEKNETIEEFNSRKVYEYIFKTIWKNNEKEKVAFLNNFHAKENIEKLENQWKSIQQKLTNLNQNGENSEQILQEYQNFVSQNWLFILERLDKIKLSFHNWYSFPDQFDENGNVKVAHTPEFKELIAKQEPLTEPFFYANKLLESISEGDTSLVASTYKDLYILKQNTLINLRIDTSTPKAKVTLNPFVYHFPKTKNKISVKILTEIFHQALYHASQESYLDFENDFVKKFRYNLPAQMIFSETFKEKDEKK
ncbi:aromatic motif membrane protein [Mesomycoplasma dispar]|uniref:Lipoprotein n=1 Tax=Mesomycoplasma dispar TaxID=86660 RepID=A0ABN5DRX7_9BACT|nr:aromatic motif membrane protein [Mesomycoplasma dispar]ATP59734.1 hypothetical protein CSW10_02185 [Mesomycoplasma dispar]